MLLNQIWLMIWKRYTYRKRHLQETVIEIFFLIFCYFSILALRYHDILTKILPNDGRSINTLNGNDCFFTILFYLPINAFNENLLSNFIHRENIANYKRFTNVTSMTKYVNRIEDITKDTFIIIFGNGSYNYSIQSLDNIKLDTKYLPTSSVIKSAYESSYKNSRTLICMTKLQEILDDSFIQATKTDFRYSFNMQTIQLPESFRKYVDKLDPFYYKIYPIIISIMTLGTCLAVSLFITTNYDSDITELSRLMGQNLYAQFIGLGAHVLILISILTAIFVAAFKTQTYPFNLEPIVRETPISIPLLTLVFFLYFLSSIMLYLLIMALIANKQVALLIAAYSSQLMIPYSNDGTIFDILLRFLPSSQLVMCFKIIKSFANIGKELDFSQTNIVLFVDSKVCVPFSNVITWLCALTVIYMVATLYIYMIKPGTFGVAKKWYFPITDLVKKYITIRKKSSVKNYNQKKFRGISILGLCKRFDSKKYVLKNVNLFIENNQITALLGKNGAGKSTMMKIITGTISATKGDVNINGHSVITDLHLARKDMGLCPQDNIHCPYWTVKEHFVYFSILKGKSFEAAKIEAENCMQLLNLTEKATSLPENLSNGMKRKLSLGIAIMGGSNTLILDEPSSGLDPQSRRELWNILMSLKKDRTILLSTHFMEEAEEISDNIIIMDDGQIITEGPASDLKRLYANGYKLTVTIHDCNKELIVETIHKWISNAKLIKFYRNNMVFQLTNYEPEKYFGIFQDLEILQTKGKVINIDFTLGSLEDVFLKTTSNFNKEDTKNVKKYIASNEGINYRKLQNCKLHLTHFRVLFYKRYLYMLRHWKFFAFSILLVIISLVLLITKSGHKRVLMQSTNSKWVSFDQNLYELNDEIVYVQYMNEQGDFLQNFVNILNKTVNYKVIRVEDDLKKKLMETAESNFDGFTRNIITAYSLSYNNTTEKLSVDCYTNGFVTYANNIGVNRIANTLLKFITKDEKRSINVNITFGNDYRRFRKLSGETVEIIQVIYWLLLLLSILVLITYYCTFPIHENNNLRCLQYIFGITPFKYWLSNFVFDYVMYLIIIGIAMTSIRIWSNINDLPVNKLGEITINLMEFGATGIIFMYLIGILFKSILKAYAVIISIIGVSIFTGVIIQLILRTWKDYLKWFVFVQYGTFILKISLDKLIINNDPNPTNVFMKGKEFSSTETAIILLINSVIFAILITAIETKIPEKIITRYQKRMATCKNDTILYSDVENEQTNVDYEYKFSQKASGDMLINHLTKAFGSLCAVNDVSLKVQSGQCFVLLGTSGAGKSTLFRMLTNDLIPTHGDACIGNYSLKHDLRSYLLKLGYCPQANLLLDYCTGRETLRIFAMIKGVNNADIEDVVNKWLSRLNLTPDADKISKYYSGGMKRRLFAAIAMIGNPTFALLDEPTTGIDPLGKRQFWLSLNIAKDLGQSILLTSHSMDECESLCDRLAIMHNSRLVCIGTLENLKDKFWRGFNISVKFTKFCTHVQKDLFYTVMSKSFPNSSIIMEKKEIIHYQTATDIRKWSDVLEKMENIKFQNQDIIVDYIVEKTTLEQLFLSFTE